MAHVLSLRSAITVLAAAAVAVAAGCGGGSQAEPSAAGVALDTRELAADCNLGENFDCEGATGPNAALAPDGLILVVSQGAYAPAEYAAWGRLVSAGRAAPSASC